MKPSLFLLTAALPILSAGAAVFPGADENSPSRSHYFTWINNTNEGATEAQTAANMAFFQWLHDEYGMNLDIYAFDAGAIDAPSYYGTLGSRKFRGQFPQGFGPLAEKAAGFGGRLGVWLGPDGFGTTPEDEQARIDMLVSLCRDHRFELFKMDAVCGQLRDGKQPAFIRLMEACRKHRPELILLNHRLNLGEGVDHATTFLWEGAETYIDVHMSNSFTAPHPRAQALRRGLPPELKRLAEDHGVCLSSCLDFWEEDLVLQAFNRSMILAPQLYGSPFFLRDGEYPKLARIFNLHRKYRDILVKGMVLPEAAYGPHAVSRGDGRTRLITLRNLGWEPVTYQVALDASIGLEGDGPREVRLFHPYEQVLGRGLEPAAKVGVEVAPFRAALVLVTEGECDEPSLPEGPYRVVKAVAGGAPVIEKLVPVPLKQPWHRKLATLQSADLPADWQALLEATYFAADNNALELRSLERSGPTSVPAVAAARQSFLDQALMRSRALSDDYLFDGDLSTVFDVFVRNRDLRIAGGCLRVDFGKAVELDHLAIHTQALDSTLIENELSRGEFSRDLAEWVRAEEAIVEGNTLHVYPPAGGWRYFRLRTAPERVAEIEASKQGVALSRDGWRASNLFAHPEAVPAVRAWSGKVTVDELAPTSYLCVAVEGEHGVEGCYPALRCDGRWIGAPDRAASYPSNAWEYPVRQQKTGYTYYFPLDASMVGKEIEVVLLGMKGGGEKLEPAVWVTARELPFTAAGAK